MLRVLVRPTTRCASTASTRVFASRLCSDSGGGSSMHSSDIAFKPNDDGWGYTRSYASGWDKIFKKGPGKKEDAAPASPSPEMEASQVDVELRQKQLAALDAALKCGALSSKLFGQAVAELDGKKE